CRVLILVFFFFSSRRRHTRSKRDWSSDVCSSDLCPHFTVSIVGLMVRAAGRDRQCFVRTKCVVWKRYCFRRGCFHSVPAGFQLRSEERRVGKECRCRWRPAQTKKRRYTIWRGCGE